MVLERAEASGVMVVLVVVGAIPVTFIRLLKILSYRLRQLPAYLERYELYSNPTLGLVFSQVRLNLRSN